MISGGTYMNIQSYQVHNVLNVYRRQLSQVKSDQPRLGVTPNAQSDAVTISAQEKNQSIMEKVTASVLKKITNVEPGTDFDQEMIRQTQHTAPNQTRLQKDKAFTFNTIVENNQKETRSIAVDNSQMLMNRLDELAKAAVNRKAE